MNDIEYTTLPFYNNLTASRIFIVVAVLSLVVYNIIPSTKNEEDYS